MRDTYLFRRRNLPHMDVPGTTYFVTTCLEGSIPAQGLIDIAGYRDELAARERPSHISADEWEQSLEKLHFARTDQWLDLQLASRHLAQPELAEIVRSSIAHFAGSRYDVLAYVIMPSHLHWVFKPCPQWIDSCSPDGDRTPREVIMHSLKRYTAIECNRLLIQSGAFWQAESYDHWIRDEEELLRCIAYVENNPVTAGLVKSPVEFRYSSAFDR